MVRGCGGDQKWVGRKEHHRCLAHVPSSGDAGRKDTLWASHPALCFIRGVLLGVPVISKSFVQSGRGRRRNRSLPATTLQLCANQTS